MTQIEKIILLRRLDKGVQKRAEKGPIADGTFASLKKLASESAKRVNEHKKVTEAMQNAYLLLSARGTVPEQMSSFALPELTKEEEREAVEAWLADAEKAKVDVGIATNYNE